MKKTILSLLSLLLLGLWLLPAAARAEIALDTHIPDPGFRAWLLKQPYGKTGVIADADIPFITNITLPSGTTIRRLEGIERFTGLKSLICFGIGLTDLPEALPQSLEILNCSANGLTRLPSLPAGLRVLELSFNNITTMPDLSGLADLEVLDCSGNRFSTLPGEYLPAGLTHLACVNTGLQSLPDLSGFTQLTVLDCNSNSLSALPGLPPALERLYCYKNRLQSLPPLPSTLQDLYCGDNFLTTLPPLPPSLTTLWCTRNRLTALPPLPKGLRDLQCSGNRLAAIDLSGLGQPLYFLGGGQLPQATMESAGNGTYTATLAMSGPEFRAVADGPQLQGIRYDPQTQTLYSTNRALTAVPFRGKTGHPDHPLFLGNLQLQYEGGPPEPVAAATPSAADEDISLPSWYWSYLLVGILLAIPAYRKGAKVKKPAKKKRKRKSNGKRGK